MPHIIVLALAWAASLAVQLLAVVLVILTRPNPRPLLWSFWPVRHQKIQAAAALAAVAGWCSSAKDERRSEVKACRCQRNPVAERPLFSLREKVPGELLMIPSRHWLHRVGHGRPSRQAKHPRVETVTPTIRRSPPLRRLGQACSAGCTAHAVVRLRLGPLFDLGGCICGEPTDHGRSGYRVECSKLVFDVVGGLIGDLPPFL